MKGKPRWAFQDQDIAGRQPNRPRFSATLCPADPKQRIIPQADRNNRLREIGLVPVLMHPHAGVIPIKVDQTAIRCPMCARNNLPHIQNRLWNRRPLAPVRMALRIPVPLLIRNPTKATGAGHAHAHRFSLGRYRRKKWCCRHNIAKRPDQRRLSIPSEKALVDPGPIQQEIRLWGCLRWFHRQNLENDSLFSPKGGIAPLAGRIRAPYIRREAGKDNPTGQNLGSRGRCFRGRFPITSPTKGF